MESINVAKMNNMTDFELLTLYKADNNNEALMLLFSRYQPMIIARIRHFDFPANDVEDLCQECMIGLYSAIISYEPSKSSFSTFSRLCIDRMLISALRSRNRASAVPEDAKGSLEDNEHLVSENSETDPQLILERLDSFEGLKDKAQKELSSLEYSVLIKIFGGMTYKEVAKAMKLSEKAVDNAVQRIRRKFSKL